MLRHLMASAMTLALCAVAHASDTTTLAGQWILREVAATEGGCLIYLTKAPNKDGILEVNFDSSAADCPLKPAAIAIVTKIDSWSLNSDKIVFTDKAKAPVMELADSKTPDAIVYMDAAKEYQIERVADLD